MRFGGFGARYATALAVDALGAGLLRPFLVLYGVSVLRLPAADTGLALSAGLLAGLVAVPLTGRWIDAGARAAPVAATLLVRVAGIGVLLAAHGVGAFAVAVLLLGIGNQAWPPAHAALVAALAGGAAADAPLAAARSLRNAALGLGALVAAAAVAGGPAVLRVLAFCTAVGYLAAAVLVLSLRHAALAAPSLRTRAVRDPGGRGPGGLLVLAVANVPFALCYAVLEVVLPVVLTTGLHAPAAWSAVVFAGNTVLVVALQVPVVLRLAGRSRRAVLAWSGVVLALSYAGFWGAGGPLALAAFGVLYTLGEILYAGSGTALVAAAARPGTLGRELSRFQLSTGVANALAPALLLGLLDLGNGPLWTVLIGVTLLAAVAVGRWGPVPEPMRPAPRPEPERPEEDAGDGIVKDRVAGDGVAGDAMACAAAGGAAGPVAPGIRPAAGAAGP